MNVALTGFMGAGKSTVGRRLARMLDLRFVDLDAEIARAHGPIPEIFAREGEAQFRRWEHESLAHLLGNAGQVIAVGGGAVLDPANRALLRKNAYVVHLSISPEHAYQRVAHRTHRPVLGEVPTLERVRELMAERADTYADNDFSIGVDGSSAGRIAGAIARWYRSRERAT
ncbi:MAG: shikimate kinase [Candidatus Eremiobacteraeota bacterium]|nr:shikimate kinase [Candidatus Eremiobacteraeota bacterium]